MEQQLGAPAKAARNRAAPGTRRSIGRHLVAAVMAAILVAGCDSLAPGSPPATPTDFAGIVAELAAAGISVDHVVEGDPGCPDERLARTAISFDATGAGQSTATRVYLYAFKDATVYQALRPAIDTCARSYVVDPNAYAAVDASPYVLAGPGPWAPAFKDALRTGLQRAAVGG